MPWTSRPKPSTNAGAPNEPPAHRRRPIPPPAKGEAAPMLLFSSHITPRLNYIVDFIGNELFDDHNPITITTDATAFAAAAGPRINYSHQDIPGCFTLRPAPTASPTATAAIPVAP